MGLFWFFPVRDTDGYPRAVLSLEQGLMILLLSVEDGRGLLRAAKPGNQCSHYGRTLCDTDGYPRAVLSLEQG